MSRSISVLGDIHGEFQPIRDLYQNNKEYFDSFDENILILLGDVGFNYFFNHRDIKFKEKVGKYPFTYFCIRGNHEQRPSIIMEDNPADWEMQSRFGNEVYVEKEYPYILYALDTVAYYNIEGYNTLVIPGAYSVDKFFRLNSGRSWFEKEQLDEQEKEEGLKLIKEIGNKADLVLTHTCPAIYIPSDLFLPTVDQNTVDNGMERYLGEIEFNLKYKMWLFGHYHAFRCYPKYEGKRVIMLFNKSALNLTDGLDEIVHLYLKGNDNE